jgi:hypothetical protein
MALSDLIQQNAGNLLSSGDGLGGGLFNSVFGVGQGTPAQNLKNSNILNSSPLDLQNVNTTPDYKSNPYGYATTYYPENVSNLGTGNYMIFDILATDTSTSTPRKSQGSGSQLAPTSLDGDTPNVFSKTIVTGTTYDTATGTQVNTYGPNPNYNVNGTGGVGAAARITQQSSGINNSPFVGSRHTRIVNSIVLYTPPSVKTSYNVQYDTPETGFVGKMAEASGQASLSSLLAGGANILSELGQVAVALIPGGGDLKAVQQKITGAAINPHIEMVFKSVPMREFDYTFEFAPKNETELKRVQEILFLFKYHMQPELGYGNDFVVPSEFQITYMYLDKRNAYIPRISKCVLKSMDIEHGDQTIFSTFAADQNGAAPVYTKMTLKFGETEIMTKTTVNRGF